MRVVYLDTSVLVSIFFEEGARDNAVFLKLLNKAEEVISSALLEAEFLSVLHREKANRDEGLKLLKQVSLLNPDRSLQPELRRVFSMAYLRGADAFHLACALYLDPSAGEISFLSADDHQNSAAKKLKFKTV